MDKEEFEKAVVGLANESYEKGIAAVFEGLNEVFKTSKVAGKTLWTVDELLEMINECKSSWNKKKPNNVSNGTYH